VNYGKYTDDHWAVGELLALAQRERSSR
jgi:hypothetical protein